MFHAQHVFSWLSAHCIGEISRNLGKYLSHALLLFRGAPSCDPRRTPRFHDVSRRIWCCGEWRVNPFVNRAKLCEAPIPPCRESFFAGMRHCSLAVLCDDFGGQRLVAIKFPNHPSIWYVYTPWKTHWCTIMYNKMHTCLDNWTPDQLPCP